MNQHKPRASQQELSLYKGANVMDVSLLSQPLIYLSTNTDNDNDTNTTVGENKPRFASFLSLSEKKLANLAPASTKSNRVQMEAKLALILYELYWAPKLVLVNLACEIKCSR